MSDDDAPDPLADLVRAWPEPALLATAAGVIVSANEDAAALLHVDAPAAGRALSDVIGPDAAAALLAAPASQVLQLPGAPEGEIVEARSARTPAGGVLLALADGARARRLGADLDQAQRLASIGELLSSVAHELNNPLTSVLGYAEILLADDDPALPRAELECIRDEARRCRRIVQNLLDLARAEQLRMQPLLLQDVLRKVEEFRAYAANSKGIELRVEAEPELPFVQGDFHRLVQALLNLVTNAEYAVAERREGRRITVRAVRSGLHAAVEVEDTGPGVPPEIRERVFEPFFTTKPRGRGTGLGLSLVRATVQAHGGTVRVERGAAGGARFVIELPLATE